MTSMNMVVLVGTLVKDPEIGTTGRGTAYARLSVETEKFIRINGERTRIAAVHSVICFNTFSVTYLQNVARGGHRIRVLGELTYDRSGRAEVQVPQYGGEIGPMDAEPRQQEPAAGNDAGRQPASGSASKPSGGFGTLSRRTDDDGPPPQRQAGSAAVSTPLGRGDELDDSIPY